MSKMAAILLAAGQGTRMKSSLPKILHEIAGFPLIHYPLQIAQKIKASPIAVVIGHQASQVRETLKNNSSLRFVIQKQQLGSAHAVLSAEKALKNFKGNVLIFSGDVPLLREETIQQMIELHQTEENDLTLGIIKFENPTGYGRIIRNYSNDIIKIIEEPDLDPQQKKIKEVNGGLYIAKIPTLFNFLKKVKKNPIKKEYYFTDLPEILHLEGLKVGGFLIPDPNELLGVNNRYELSVAEKLMQRRIQKKIMLDGVTVLDPERTLIHNEVKIGLDTIIHPEVSLLGKTKIGKKCILEQGAILKDVILADHVVIKAYSHLEGSVVQYGAVIGPFARIRPDSIIGKNAKIGNFVELKKTKLGEGSKANHLTYLGDALIGKEVNIGAGTITCNYDGVKKYQTKIEDGVFVGSDTQFVAPVRIGKNAYVGAGTTVTKNVPGKSLALSRSSQKNILGYSKSRKK